MKELHRTFDLGVVLLHVLDRYGVCYFSHRGSLLVVVQPVIPFRMVLLFVHGLVYHLVSDEAAHGYYSHHYD